MALDNSERLALHQGLVDGLGRETADRLMNALPPGEVATKDDLARLQAHMDHRFELVDHRFELVDQRFQLLDERFGRFDERFGRFEERFVRVEERFARFEERFDGLGQMIDGRIATQIRGLFFALAGLYLANTALLFGALSLAD
jgi:hypothetical protein